jgi:hypothetical protein
MDLKGHDINLAEEGRSTGLQAGEEDRETSGL